MEPILRNIEKIDWITLLILSSLVFIIIAKKAYYHRFLNFIILPFNNKYIFMYNKKEKLFNWFHILLTLFQIINTSIFIFLSWKIFAKPQEVTTASTSNLFLLILGGIILFQLLKLFLQLFNGFIFDANKIISALVFKKTSYLNYSAILMFFANVTLCYVLIGSKSVVYVTFALILLINGIGWATLLRNHQNFIASNFFYFILYLCTLEIAPWLIIGSHINN